MKDTEAIRKIIGLIDSYIVKAKGTQNSTEVLIYLACLKIDVADMYVEQKIIPRGIKNPMVECSKGGNN